MKIEKKVHKLVNNYFPDSNIDQNNWKDVIENSNSQSSVFHILNTVKYYVSYFSKNNSINLSMVFYQDTQAIGIMPLMIHQDKNNSWIISSNGSDIIEPIFKKNLAEKFKKKIEIKIINLIFDLSKLLKIKKCQFVNINFFKLSKWYLRLLDLSEYTFTSHHLLVDLSLSIDQIKTNLRKSFKSLVNKGQKEWNIQVHEKISKEQFENLRLLHKFVAGKSTRPIESWDVQNESINSKESIVITIYDKKDLLVGFGLFIYNKNFASYAVGVYKRELFDKPLGHVVQMKAIEIFKSKGLKWYEIGNKHLKIDVEPPTKKELSISFFKEGFATDVLIREHAVVKNIKRI